VHDQLGTIDEFKQLVHDLSEFSFVLKKFGGYSMHLQGAFLDLTIRIEIMMEATSCQSPAHHFHRSDFDDSMTELRLESRRFGVYKNLTHQPALPSIADNRPCLTLPSSAYRKSLLPV
jgi:hypothetical protein